MQKIWFCIDGRWGSFHNYIAWRLYTWEAKPLINPMIFKIKLLFVSNSLVYFKAGVSNKRLASCVCAAQTCLKKSHDILFWLFFLFVLSILSHNLLFMAQLMKKKSNLTWYMVLLKTRMPAEPFSLQSAVHRVFFVAMLLPFCQFEFEASSVNLSNILVYFFEYWFCSYI